MHKWFKKFLHSTYFKLGPLVLPQLLKHGGKTKSELSGVQDVSRLKPVSWQCAASVARRRVKTFKRHWRSYKPTHLLLDKTVHVYQTPSEHFKLQHNNEHFEGKILNYIFYFLSTKKSAIIYCITASVHSDVLVGASPTGMDPSPDTSDRAVFHLWLLGWGSARVPLLTEADPALCSCSLLPPGGADQCHTRVFSPGRDKYSTGAPMFSDTYINTHTSISHFQVKVNKHVALFGYSEKMKSKSRRTHTFSLSISPVSLAGVFDSPLPCLLHSTRGSWRKVLSTLKRKRKILTTKNMETYNTSSGQKQNIQGDCDVTVWWV